MTKKEKSEHTSEVEVLTLSLSQLNQKFDVLIQVLLDRQNHAVLAAKPADIVESKDIAVEASQASPRGAFEEAFRKDTEVLLGSSKEMLAAPIQETKQVSLFVDPNMLISINGLPYEGNITVEEGLATVIRRMVGDWKNYQNKILRDVTHPTREHTISGNM